MSGVGECKGCGEVVGGKDIPTVLWNGVRFTVMLASGSHMDLTVCDRCAKVAAEDEDGFLGELEEVVVKLWRRDGDSWLKQYFKFGTPFMAVSHVIPWSVAGKGR